MVFLPKTGGSTSPPPRLSESAFPGEGYVLHSALLRECRCRSKYAHATFNPKDVEGRIYAQWEASGAFKAGRRPGAPAFCIMIPPPNITGRLHIGHALNNTLQDILVRFERMRGKDVLWQVGTDHAGIATQMIVERQSPSARSSASNSAARNSRSI